MGAGNRGSETLAVLEERKVTVGTLLDALQARADALEHKQEHEVAPAPFPHPKPGPGPQPRLELARSRPLPQPEWLVHHHTAQRQPAVHVVVRSGPAILQDPLHRARHDRGPTQGQGGDAGGPPDARRARGGQQGTSGCVREALHRQARRDGRYRQGAPAFVLLYM